ncbi:hypothetical protein F7C95_15840 [Opitutia bacterium ISCC 51]|nr:hypothetical protein F7C95_15840 [Opitutae bacterium ISCC 51]QXD27453.1 hypothetical protein GA003_15740 [Opitutae bacterium ISCC 52]
MLLLIKSAGWILATLPRQYAQLLSIVLGDLIYFSPTRCRRTILSNFHHTFPDKPTAWRRVQARTSCRRTVETYLFKLALPFFSDVRLDRTLIATEDATELLSQYTNPAKPLIGVTIHSSLMEAGSLVPRTIDVDNPEVGVLYEAHKNKKRDAYRKAHRAKHGVTLIDAADGIHQARTLIKNNGWMILVIDQSVESSGYLSFFLNRTASTAGFHQLLAQNYEADVLAFYGERTGFWEGNLQVEKIAEGKKDETVVLKTNQWLENKLLNDELFRQDWMWLQERWDGQVDPSQNLSIDQNRNLVEESRTFYNWDQLPKNNRIWFRMPNHLGDLVKWIPFIRTIRSSRPDAEISLLVKRQFAPLVEALQVCDKIIEIPKRNSRYIANFFRLRNQFPDTYYQLTTSLAADIEARLVNAPRRYGILWPGAKRPLLTDTFKMDPGWDERKNHQTALWENFLRHFGLQGDIDFSPLRLAPANEVINPLRCLQTESREAPYFGLICGAGNHPEKCWPVDYWIECVASLMDLYPDSNICLFGAKPDLPVSRQIIERFEPGSIHDFTGSTNLMQFVMAVRSCSVVISNDCGGVHLANALGIPTIGLYGITNPVFTKPVFNSTVKVVQPSNCPRYGGASSNLICLSQVIEAVSDIVKQPEQPQRETTMVS